MSTLEVGDYVAVTDVESHSRMFDLPHSIPLKWRNSTLCFLQWERGDIGIGQEMDNACRVTCEHSIDAVRRLPGTPRSTDA